MEGRPENRLAREASPYLQQHAHNPVDWYPWGPEALSRAQSEDLPIFLSIGYSACHWCHVMERESFEDADLARQLSTDFVCIKVDREERPDLDQLYQTVVQLMGRSGGWPLTVFLTPAQRPFFAGTYFPPVDRHGRPGLGTVLRAVSEAYRDRRDQIEAHADEVVGAIVGAGDRHVALSASARSAALSAQALARTADALAERTDERYGGFGTRPKFPNAMCLDVLLRRAALDGDRTAEQKVRRALDGMQNGGICDQLGGGFHRYSTDEKWLVPHFEKMLYDNALLLGLYTDAYRAFGDPSYRETALATGDYLLREMQSPEGGFFASQDADSEGVEGKFFVFTEHEVKDLLASDPLARDVALLHFGIDARGNFEATSATVLSRAVPLDEVARELGVPVDRAQEALARARMTMRAAREQRVRPFRDEKILASWSALAIGALADAARVLDRPEFLAAASHACDRIDRQLVNHGRVERLVKDGVVKGPGFLDDHAFLAAAMIDLYEVSGDPRRLECARQIADVMLARFWDEGSATFFLSPSDGEKLIARSKDQRDQAIPSGASVACEVLLRLGAMVDEGYERAARRYLEGIAAAAIANPLAFGRTLGALDRLVRGSTDVVIVAARSSADGAALHDVAQRAYVPHRNLVWADPADARALAAAPLLTADKPSGERARAYVCRHRTCGSPISAAAELALELAPAQSRQAR